MFFSNSVRIGYLSQAIDIKSLDKMVIEIFKNVSTKEEIIKLKNLLFSMGFDENMLNQQIDTLSLGEITRLRIAKLIIDNYEIMILDEPSNHLEFIAERNLKKH